MKKERDDIARLTEELKTAYEKWMLSLRNVKSKIPPKQTGLILVLFFGLLGAVCFGYYQFRKQQEDDSAEGGDNQYQSLK